MLITIGISYVSHQTMPICLLCLPFSILLLLLHCSLSKQFSKFPPNAMVNIFILSLSFVCACTYLCTVPWQTTHRKHTKIKKIHQNLKKYKEITSDQKGWKNQDFAECPHFLRANFYSALETRHRHFTRHKTWQLGILLDIGIQLGIKLGNRHFYQVP